MQVTFTSTDVQVINPPHKGPDKEKDARVYDKCLQAYLYMVINNITEFTDEEGNTFIRKE